MSIAERARSVEAGPLDLVILPTAIRDVVTIRGSVDTWPDFASGAEIAQEWMAAALDKGTLQKDRFEVASILENLGAQMGFSSATARVRYSARCLSSDLETVLGLLLEQLLQPAFDASELEKGRDRIASSIQRSLTEAGYRSDVALARALFPDGHPNSMLTPNQELEVLKKADVDSVRAHHADMLRGAPRMVIVGDVDPDTAVALVSRVAAGWEATGEAPEADAPQPAVTEPGSSTTEIADRDNLEVRWGQTLPLRRTDDAYLTAHMASFILGGNFSARLMNQVRDRHGLTYGVGSGLRGADRRYSGMWRVHVTLSRENLDRGIEVTESVMREWAEGGVTAEELAEKKDTIAGAFQVRQATTGGLAGSILQQMEDGRSLDWVDNYPDRIRAITLGQVNQVIARHFDPARLHRSVAGTIPQGIVV